MYSLKLTLSSPYPPKTLAFMTSEISSLITRAISCSVFGWLTFKDPLTTIFDDAPAFALLDPGPIVLRVGPEDVLRPRAEGERRRIGVAARSELEPPDEVVVRRDRVAEREDWRVVDG